MAEALVTYVGEAVLEYLGEAAFEAFVTAAIYAPYVIAAASVYNLREQQRRAKSAYNNGLTDRYVMQRTATGQRQLVLGRARVSGPITFLHSYGNNNTTLALCVVLAAHECDAVEDIYFNDTPLILDGSGNVVGTKNVEHFSISGTTASFKLGAVGVNGTASAVATYDTGDVNLGVSMTGDGLTLNVTGGTAGKVGSVVVTYQPYVVVYTPTRIQDSHQQQTAGSSSGSFTVPTNCITSSAVVVDIGAGGYQTALSFTRTGNTINYTGATAGHTVHLMYQAGTTYSRARITVHLGQAGQTADSGLLSALPSLWTSSHRGDGLCYLKVELDYDPTTFPNGIPNISAVVRGAKCYDPRTSTTAWTDNPALLLRAYYLHPLGAARSSSEINDAAVIAAANVCDGTVTYHVGTHYQTRARYKASTVALKDRRPQDVLTDLAQAMGGRWVISGNQLVVKAGSFSSPVASIDDSWLHSGSAVVVQPRPNRADLTNSMAGSFADEEQAWQTVAYPTVKAAAYITADGAELQTRVDYPAITYSGQAQYVSACALRYNRSGLTVRLSCNLRAFPLEVFDVVSVSLARFGWSAKTFEVIATSFTADGLVDLTLKEIDATIWALDAAYLATDYATKTFLPSPWSLTVPTLGTPASGTTYLLRQADGSIVSRIYVPITGVVDQAVLQGGSIEVAYSRVSDPDQSWYSITVPGDATGAFLANVNDGAVYVIKARAKNRIGESAWSQQITHQVVGKSQLPSAVSGLTLTVVPGALRGSRTPSTDVDYSYTIYRYGSTFAGGTAVPGTSDGGGFLWPWPALGSYTVWAADVDTTGNVGTAVSATVTVDSSLYIGSGSITPDAGWLNSNVLVGGRNILAGASNGSGWTYDYFSGTEFRVTRAATTETGYIYSTYQTIPSSTQITLSFESKQIGSVSSADLFILPDTYGTEGLLSVSYALSSNWVKNTFTFTTPSGWVSPSRLRIDHNGGDGSSSSVCVRNVKLEYGNKATDWTPPIEDVAAASAAAQATANTAATNASSALTQLTNIASDSILSPSEKPSVVQDYAVITGEQSGIDAQATAYGITTEKTAYDTAVSALTTYLGTLSGWNTVPGSDVAIVGTTFRSKFADVYTARQTLLNKIAAVAGTVASWSGVSGTGKPADYATVGAADAATAFGFNPQFSAWSGTYPDNWGAWNGNTPTKETGTVRTPPYAVRFVVASDTGMQYQANFTNTPTPFNSFVSGAYDAYIVANAGGAGKPGILVRLFTNAALTTFRDTTVPVIRNDVGGWQRMPFSARVASGEQIYAVQVYVMAAWSGMPTGRWSDGSVVLFDNLTFDMHDGTTDASLITLGGLGFTGATNANYTTNTNQLTDGANLGGTAAWTGVGGRPANLAGLGGSEPILNTSIGLTLNANGTASASGGPSVSGGVTLAGLAGGALSVSLNNTGISYSATVPFSYTTTNVTATASGGKTPYTYRWALAFSQQSNGCSLVINAATNATTSFTGSVSGSGNGVGAFAVCTVTDANGLSATASIYVSIVSNA